MKIVLQDGIKDCGVCSLLSIIRFYGGDVSKEYLREITNTSKSGVSAYKLLEGATKIGFSGMGVKGDLKNIKNDNLPCLSHLVINKSYQHFVVLYDIDYDHKKVTIMDPAKGKRVLSFSEFRLLSSNYFIFLKPIKKLPVIHQKKMLVKSIINFSCRNKITILLISLLSLLYFIFNIITAFHFKYLLEYAINYKSVFNIIFISIFLLIIYILKEFTYLLQNTLLLKWISMFDEKITLSTYKQIILLPYLYYKNRTTGEVISRIKDLTTVKSFLVQFFCSIMTDLLTVIIFIVFLFNISFKLTIWVLLVVLFLFLYNLLMKKVKRRKTTNYYHQEEKINSYLIESLSSVDSFKNLHVESDIIHKFRLKYQKYLESFYRRSFFLEIDQFFKNSINCILLILVYGIGAYFVVIKEITIAELFVYQGILNYFLISFNHLISLQSDYHSFNISLRRIEDMFTIKEEIFDGGGYYHFYRLTGDISFSNLSYAYSRSSIFNNLNLTINNGCKLLITGPSGTGKSTLVKMLMRYIEVPYGTIKINDIDINHYHLDVIRNKIAYVTGGELLFSNTIYNNIVLNRGIDKKQVFNISKLVLVDEVVEKDNLGYEKIIEENGFNFSGGERQRIILARTLLKNSDIYIFDEALSQIDIERERKILKNIFQYLKDKTVIVISHRFHNQDLFEKIVRIENGDICELKEI